MRLYTIVANKDLTALEAYVVACKTYRELIELAESQGVDLDELEDLLRQI